MKLLPTGSRNNKSTFTRRGVRISPRVHKVRMIIYMILIPVLTWYGHQKYTNPFRYHPNMHFGGVEPTLSLFCTTTKDTADCYTFLWDYQYYDSSETVYTQVEVTDSGFGFDSTRTSSMSFSETYCVWNPQFTSINYYDYQIIIPSSDSVPVRDFESVDLLIIDVKSVNYEMWRSKVAPRLTILYNTDNDDSLPSNVIMWVPGTTLEIVEGRNKRLDANIVQ